MIDGDAGHQVEIGNVVKARQDISAPVGGNVPVGIAAAAIPANPGANDAGVGEPVNIANDRAINARWQVEGVEAATGAATGGDHIKALPNRCVAIDEGAIQGARQIHVAGYGQDVVLTAGDGATQFGFDGAAGGVDEVSGDVERAGGASAAWVDRAGIGERSAAEIQGAVAGDDAGCCCVGEVVAIGAEHRAAGDVKGAAVGRVTIQLQGAGIDIHCAAVVETAVQT